MFDPLFAEQVNPYSDVQTHLIQVFGMGRITAACVVVVLVTFGSVLGSYLWSVLLRWCDHFRYGGWTIRVQGGKSGRSWHMPLETAISKSLRTRNFVAFKRDLGTVLSGEGQVDFSFGVPLNEPCRPALPQAPGLTIHSEQRIIEMNFNVVQTTPREHDLGHDPVQDDGEPVLLVDSGQEVRRASE